MLTYLKNLFRKKNGARETPAPSAVVARPASDAAAPMVRVETASLQLLAIMAKFPDDLREFVVKLPPPEAMVALPLPTILKFLPSGSVKMSLASVVRQAPPGTFAAMPTIEKRGVEVPLAEIFKRVSPAFLKKRDDQRYTDLADDGFDIFGDDENPFALAPRVSDPPPPPPPSKFKPAPSSITRPKRSSIQMPGAAMVAAPPLDMPAPSSRVIPAIKLASDSAVTPLAPEAADLPPPIVDDRPPLVLPLQDLVANWPEPIKSEVSVLNGATVALPAGELSAGLSKGKVAFQWGQIRAWLSPAPTAPTEGDDATELSLPLRVIAPAFLKHSKKPEQKKKLSIDASIPELFGGPAATPPAPVEPQPEPAIETAPAPVLAEAAPAPAPELPVQVAESQPAELPVLPAPIFADEAPAASAAPEDPAPPVATASEEASIPPIEKFEFAPNVHETPAPVVTARPVPQSLSELFNEPGRANWSPTDLIAAMLATLPTVDGAIIALQEGLVVAHHLPEGFKGDVFAAFLPQMFARINQYSGEMKLGTVNDLVLNADGRQCQLFRIGQIFFGVLAKPNETLPWHELRLCANSLAE
jgi:predicted regulator of Ras-like GTPase activity (Roadblock/LC7/MglB family)